MRPSIFNKTVRDLRLQVVWYGIGLGILAALVVFIYPSYRDQFAEFEIPEALQGFVGDADYTSPEGFLSAEFFSFTPALLVIFAIMAGTSALAGEEVAGTLELVLAQPITRRALVLQKMAAIAFSSGLIAIAIYAGWLLSVPFVDIDISFLKLAVATLFLIPITLLFAFLSVWAAAILPDRRVATGLVSGIAIFSYFANYLATVVDVLSPLRWLSFFYYHDGANALTEPEPLKLAVLLIATLTFAILAVTAFEKREIGVRSEFSLPRMPLADRLKWKEAADE